MSALFGSKETVGPENTQESSVAKTTETNTHMSRSVKGVRGVKELNDLECKLISVKSKLIIRLILEDEPIVIDGLGLLTDRLERMLVLSVQSEIRRMQNAAIFRQPSPS